MENPSAEQLDPRIDRPDPTEPALIDPDAPPAGTETSPASSSSPRRRNRRCHEAILKAAADLLEEKGYSGVCIEAIAARAGVGKQTIYRWWPSKAAIIMEAYAETAARAVPLPDTSSVRTDLNQMLGQLVALLSTSSTGIAVSGLIAEAQKDPVVANAFREQFIAGRRTATRQVLQRGIDRGELRSDLDLELTIDAIYGPIWYRLLLRHAPLDQAFAAELVTYLLQGIEVKRDVGEEGTIGKGE